MSEPMLGQIQAFGFNFAPRGWAECNGQLLAISSNSALFSLLGTIYGGDGRTTFGLPDLRGRSMIHMGQGPGLRDYRIGQRGGAETTTLNTVNMPSHNHTATLHSENAVADKSGPAGRMLGVASGGVKIYADVNPAEDKTMAAESIRVENTGGGQSFDIHAPFLTVNVCIALQGLFPSRN